VNRVVRAIPACPVRPKSGHSANDLISRSFNSLHCLPALNGATCALGNFPQCLTARSRSHRRRSPLSTTTHAVVLLAAAASGRAFGYTRACSRSPTPLLLASASVTTRVRRAVVAANGSRTSAICPRGQTDKRFLPKRSFGSIHSACLSALVRRPRDES